MDISRRQFNRGAAMFAGAAAMPPMPISARSGGEDAYEAILSEFFRSEEAARLAGGLRQGGGAVSAVGRQLEGFIGRLDITVSPFESSAQVYRELKGYLEGQVREAAKKAAEEVKTLGEEELNGDETGEAEADAEETPTATSTSPASCAS